MEDIYGDLCAVKAPVKAAPVVRVPAAENPRRIGSGIVVAVDALSARLAATAAAVARAQPSAPVVAAAEWAFEDGLIVEGGEVVNEYTQDFDALREELMADERARAPKKKAAATTERVVRCGAEPKEADYGGNDDGALSDCSGDGDDRVAIKLGEVKASGTGASASLAQTPRPVGAAVALGGNAAASVTNVSGGKASPPTLSLVGSTERFVLVGGLPLSFTEEGLREQAEKYGKVRSVRVLGDVRSGDSVGIALFEFAEPDAWRKAVGADGFASLAIWKSHGGQPRMVLVSKELFVKLRAGSVAWPDGGVCSADLRAILMRQFDLSHLPGAPQPINGARGNRPTSPEPRREDPANWKDKLKQLRSGVNRRLSSEDLDAHPQREDSTAWTDRLNALKRGVNQRPVSDTLDPSSKRVC